MNTSAKYRKMVMSHSFKNSDLNHESILIKKTQKGPAQVHKPSRARLCNAPSQFDSGVVQSECVHGGVGEKAPIRAPANFFSLYS